MLSRACLAAICGGLVGGIWFYFLAGPDWRGYAVVAGLVEGLLSLGSPRAGRSIQPRPDGDCEVLLQGA
jgi:hypothetical protein